MTRARCLTAASTLLLAFTATPATAAPAATPVSVASSSLEWRLVGPFRGGRTRAVTGVPHAPHTVLIGAVNGGVWRTDDDGRTWQPIFDQQPTQSIGAIAVAPSDPAIIYVASGEGLHRPDLSVGDGIYRSADGGHSWVHLALRDAQQIPGLAVDPHDPNRLFAAVLGHPYGASAERGLYRSEDGGQHWLRVLYKDDDTGASCVKLDPHDPNIVYAALWQVRSGPWEDDNTFNGTGGGLYKSTDGGSHWQPVTRGLPENLSQIEIAVSPSDSRRLYATVATSDPGDYSSGAGLGVYRSDDGGESWARATTDPRPALRIGGGDLPIISVDPGNADILYSASIVTMKSTDGGSHWMPLRGSPGGDDYQNLWISDEDPRRIALVGDQGALVTVNGGATWSSWYNQPTAQLYHVGVTPTFPYRICSGQQESGSVCISSRGNDGLVTFRDWHPVGVIEYGYVVPDPLDPDVVYGSGRNVVTRTQLSTGQVRNITPIPVKEPDSRYDRTEPLFFAPADPHHMYYAANRLYETTDAGQHWTPVSPDLSRASTAVPASVGTLHSAKAGEQRGAIYAASASGVSPGLIWLGTDDGLIWVTRNGGRDWSDVTPPALTAWSKVTQIEASHSDPLTAYASVSRFRIDDLKPYLYRTRDGGQSWQLITTGLAGDAPANTVREDPVRKGLLYAGTEKAVWVSFDDGDHWSSLQLNLPHTSMRDLVVHGADLIVATHGRSFWILDDVAPLRQYSEELARSEATLLNPEPAIRAQRSTNSDTSLAPDEPTGRNPPEGALIDYYLSRAASGPVTIEILDAGGGLVRRATSEDPPSMSDEELERELIPAYWIRMVKPPPRTAGMHRWSWDLRYAPPRTATHGFPISAVPFDTPREPQGPLAAPGQYRVRLSIGTRHWEQPLTVKPDPRVSLDAAGYASQLTVARGLADALDQSTEALLGARSLRAQSKALEVPAASTLGTHLKALDAALAELIEPAASPGQPAAAGLDKVNGGLGGLYGQVTSADAAPTAVQAATAQRLIGESQALVARFLTLRSVDVGAVNRELAGSHLAPLKPELAPPRDADQADEE